MAIDNAKSQAQARELSAQLWNISNDLRGGMDSSEFKNYILGTIFYRYLSERTENYMKELLKEDGISYEDAFSNDDYKPVVEKWSLEKLGYIIKPDNLYRELYRKIIKPQNDADKFSIEDYERAISELSGSTLGQKSEAAFEGLFDDMRLQDSRLGDSVKERSEKIGKVISRIAEINMNLEDSEFDVLGTAYMILIGLFQSDAGKKGGEFFTPTGPATLCAQLACVGLDEAKTAGDCCCGSASMLLDLKKYLKNGKIGHFYGQENNPTTYNLARMNMLMHGIDYQDFSICKGDTITNDTYGNDKMTVQVCNPPYSLKYDAKSELLDDPRYSGVGKLAPKSHADYAFVEHMIYHMDDNDGRVAVLLPHGVLFRGGAEEDIRKYIVKDLNRLDAVIGLPANLFHGTSIPVCILVLKSRRNGNSGNILFIDASKDFIKGKNQNELSDEHIEKIVNAYIERKDIDKFAHVATMEEIEQNDYNLNIPRYVDTSEEEESIDINDVIARINQTDKEIETAETELKKYFDELGIKFPNGGKELGEINKKQPNLRFPGFTDDWEQRKLGDVLDDMYNGQTPSRMKFEYWEGNINWLSSGELNRSFVYDSIEKITEEGLKATNLRVVPKGTFVMAITGLEAAGTRGNCAILGFDTALNQSCMALFPKKDLLTSEFLFQWYRMAGEEYGIRFTQGTKQQSYNAEIISKLEITLPSVEEQNKISAVLFRVDNLITLHQRKCDSLKELKKAMLQKMFV